MLERTREHKPDDLCMNSIRYRIVNPWGVHARSAAFITSVANVCAKDWEVVLVGGNLRVRVFEPGAD